MKMVKIYTEKMDNRLKNGEIEKIAQEKNYAVIFDKASGATILYVDSKTDVSDLILAELGYRINSSKKR